MAGNSLNTYLVVIRSYRHFEQAARTAVCFFRQGYRALLVTDQIPNAKHMTLVKRLSGNQSKDAESLAWCKTNLLVETRQNNHAPADVAKALELWARTQLLIEKAAKVEEEAEEVVRAGRDESDERVREEAADVLYHLGVLLQSRGLSFEDAFGELVARMNGAQ